MECTFVVGQRVLCVGKDRDPNESDARGYGTEARPRRGRVYTVRELLIDPKRGPSIRLTEIVNPELIYSLPWGKWEPAWMASAFRPLVTTKTDISLFQKILEEASNEAKEKV